MSDQVAINGGSFIVTRGSSGMTTTFITRATSTTRYTQMRRIVAILIRARMVVPALRDKVSTPVTVLLAGEVKTAVTVSPVMTIPVNMVECAHRPLVNVPALMVGSGLSASSGVTASMVVHASRLVGFCIGVVALITGADSTVTSENPH